MLYTCSCVGVRQAKAAESKAKDMLSKAKASEAKARQEQAEANAQAILDMLNKEEENKRLEAKLIEKDTAFQQQAFNLVQARASLDTVTEHWESSQKILNQLSDESIQELKVRYSLRRYCWCWSIHFVTYTESHQIHLTFSMRSGFVCLVGPVFLSKEKHSTAIRIYLQKKKASSDKGLLCDDVRTYR
jgi:DNA-binding TFAR19-related protein (PDSD5 family)